MAMPVRWTKWKKNNTHSQTKRIMFLRFINTSIIQTEFLCFRCVCVHCSLVYVWVMQLNMILWGSLAGDRITMALRETINKLIMYRSISRTQTHTLVHGIDYKETRWIPQSWIGVYTVNFFLFRWVIVRKSMYVYFCGKCKHFWTCVRLLVVLFSDIFEIDACTHESVTAKYY